MVMMVSHVKGKFFPRKSSTLFAHQLRDGRIKQTLRSKKTSVIHLISTGKKSFIISSITRIFFLKPYRWCKCFVWPGTEPSCFQGSSIPATFSGRGLRVENIKIQWCFEQWSFIRSVTTWQQDTHYTIGISIGLWPDNYGWFHRGRNMLTQMQILRHLILQSSTEKSIIHLILKLQQRTLYSPYNILPMLFCLCWMLSALRWAPLVATMKEPYEKCGV